MRARRLLPRLLRRLSRERAEGYLLRRVQILSSGQTSTQAFNAKDKLISGQRSYSSPPPASPRAAFSGVGKYPWPARRLPPAEREDRPEIGSDAWAAMVLSTLSAT